MDDWIGGKEVRVFKGFRVGRDFKVVGRVGGVFFTRGQDALAPAGLMGLCWWVIRGQDALAPICIAPAGVGGFVGG